MNEAPVGFQCPNCVAEGRRTVRKTRTAFGGGMGGGSGNVTKILVAINVIVFIIGVAIAGGEAIGGLLRGGATPLHYMGALWAPPLTDVRVGEYDDLQISGVAAGAYYRLFTSMFLHYGIIHLLFNMYVLWVIGRVLERDLGSARFLVLYLISGLGGGVLTYLFADADGRIANPNSWTMSAGASGCIFGLFGAMVLINRKLRRDNSGIYVLLGLNLVLTFSVDGISWTGHVGGLITGAALGAALAYAPRQSRTMVQTTAFVAMCLVLIALILMRTSALQSECDDPTAPPNCSASGPVQDDRPPLSLPQHDPVPIDH